MGEFVTTDLKTERGSARGGAVPNKMNDAILRIQYDMTEDIKAGRDTAEQVLGIPVLRQASFVADFKDLVRRLTNPESVVRHAWGGVGSSWGADIHPPYLLKVGTRWEPSGWTRVREGIISSVAGRIKGLATRWERRTPYWENPETGEVLWKDEWESHEWTVAEEEDKAWKDWDEQTKVERVVVTEWLPDDDALRLALFNLFWAYPGPEQGHSRGVTLLDTCVDPFQHNAEV